MGRRRVMLRITIDYDADITDGESIATMMDILMETALSTPGITDEYGNPEIGQFFVDSDGNRDSD